MKSFRTNGSSDFPISLLPQFCIRMFHASHVFYEEARYPINGSFVTITEVRAIHPTERTIAHWSTLVDWDLQKQRNFVIVDPVDPSGLLYLNQAEYLAQSKVCVSNDFPLIVVARPGTKRPVPSSSSSPSQNSPWGVEIEHKWSRQSRYTWKAFLQLRNEVGRIVRTKKGSKMVSVSSKTIARTVYSWVRTLTHYAEVKNPGTYSQYFIPFVRHLQVLLENNGRMAAVSYLKISLFALYSYVSGNPLRYSFDLGHGIRLRNGLPAIWDVTLRSRVRSGDIRAIRLLASLLNLYRALDAPHPEPDLSTITKPHPDFSQSKTFADYQKFCKEVFPTLLQDVTGGFAPFSYRSALGLLIRKAGPNLNGPSMAGIVLDANAWFKQPVNHVLEWFRLHKDTNAVNVISEINTNSHFESEKIPVTRCTLRTFLWGDGAGRTPLKWDTTATTCSSFNEELEGVTGPILGRLHAIEEPAGKVRIVAICDYWTQVALKPIHDFLFTILAKLGSDATFDQLGVVESYFQKGLCPHWSFDLKAATDSIPLALYRACLEPLLLGRKEDTEIAKRRTELWANILTDRDFLLPDASSTIRYTTGQPMGALSSWASMAIVHHSLVQFSAWRAGHTTWYQDYLVLGDDIDIARSAPVADGYVSICSDLSITIGMLKSLRSNRNVFEFANQRFCPEGNISPISIKEELSALTWTGRMEYAKRILARFGSSSKDESSALLRKASTHAQWKVLGVELSGLRSSTLTSLSRFCLLTPFQKLEGFRIDSLLNWLAPICTSADKAKLISILESAEERAKLEREVAFGLLDDLTVRVNRLIAKLPGRWEIEIPKGSFSEYRVGTPIKEGDNLSSPDTQRASNEGSVQFPEIGNTGHGGRAKALDWRIKSLYETPVNGGYTFTVGRQAFDATLYVMHCINMHNKIVQRALSDALELVQKASKRYSNPMMPTAYDHALMMTKAGPAYPHPFTGAFLLWDKIANIPEPIIPKPTGRWLSVVEDDTPMSRFTGKPISLKGQSLYENKLRAPISPIVLAIAKTTGIQVPLFPYHVWSRKGHWTHALTQALKIGSEAIRSAEVQREYLAELERQAATHKVLVCGPVGED
nr:MAG: putative RNA-dependent RNA polymerase [Mitoviridae sp.]